MAWWTAGRNVMLGLAEDFTPGTAFAATDLTLVLARAVLVEARTPARAIATSPPIEG